MRRTPALLFLWLLPATSGADDYVGVESCKTCHHAEYEQWKSTPHARSLERLSAQERQDRSCLACHTMLPFDDRESRAEVQCESCHGGGARYAARFIMRDPLVARLLGLEDIKEETCARCHAEAGPSLSPFDFAKALEAVRHRPADPKAAAKPPATEATE
ncbi:MAG: hypothetical protein HY791_08595 [Deltaproteobacteria bacterium]|nr:hypothetical protein [Deltaproteobacteria bacterium]